MPYCPPMFEGYDPASYTGQVSRVLETEKVHAVCDCLGICSISSAWATPAFPGVHEARRLINAASGKQEQETEFLNKIEGIIRLEKLYNQEYADFNRKDDYPPQRCMNEAVLTGPYKGQMIDKNDWDDMLDEYYREHGWHIKTGLLPKNEESKLKKTIRSNWGFF